MLILIAANSLKHLKFVIKFCSNLQLKLFGKTNGEMSLGEDSQNENSNLVIVNIGT